MVDENSLPLEKESIHLWGVRIMSILLRSDPVDCLGVNVRSTLDLPVLTNDISLSVKAESSTNDFVPGFIFPLVNGDLLRNYVSLNFLF